LKKFFKFFEDLVKTHLTFAVREEVEILRSTIMDLENKVLISFT